MAGYPPITSFGEPLPAPFGQLVPGSSYLATFGLSYEIATFSFTTARAWGSCEISTQPRGRLSTWTRSQIDLVPVTC